MKYFLLKKITEYLQKDAQNIKYIKRIDNNIIIIEFNNKNILYFDMAKNNSMIFKSKNIISSKKDFNALSKKIMSLLQSEGLSSREIQNKTKNTADDVIFVLQQLLEDDFLIIQKNNKYTLKT